jgi:hypothetical protein
MPRMKRVLPCGSGENDCRIWGNGGSDNEERRSTRSGDDMIHIWGPREGGRTGVTRAISRKTCCRL